MSVMDRFQFEDMDAIRIGRFNWGINTSFVIYRFGGTVFDTGSTNQWQYVKAFIKEKPLLQLILTHHHEDHSGNAGAIKALTGVTPIAPKESIDKLRQGYKTPVMQKIIWGSPGTVDADVLPDEIMLSSGEPATAVFAPGHAKDMTCYLLPERGWLLSADLYLSNHLKMLRIDENISLIMRSTQYVLDQDFDVILCPHRGVVKEGKQRLQEKLDYIANLVQQAQQLHRQGMGVTSITKNLLGKETAISTLTGNNFSKRNLVRSCLEVAL